jgi:hypothetical protein
MHVDRMFCKKPKNWDRHFLDEIAESNMPILGISNHSERSATNHALGSWNKNGMFFLKIIDIGNVTTSQEGNKLGITKTMRLSC